MSKVKKDNNGLPKGWEMLYLEDVCHKITDGTHSTPTYIKEGIPFLSVKDVTNGKISFDNCRYISKKEHQELTKRCKPEENDLLYTKVGTTGVAKVIDTDQEFSIFVSLALLKPNFKLIRSDYFEHLLNSPSVYSQAQSKTRGMANRNLVLKDIKSIQIPLPPLPEQHRIVQQLDALFERIDKAIHLTRENLEHCTHLLPAALNEVFGEMGKSKVKSEKLKSVTTKIGSGSTPSGGQRAYKTSGISLIRSMNVYDEGFEMDGLAYIDDEQANKLSNVVVETNDVLLNITGASVARCCIVPEHVLPARVNQHVSILRFKKNLIDPEFAHYFFISPDTKFKLLKDSGGGATREAITKAMLEDFEIRFPDIKRQQQIVTYLNQLSSKQQQLQQHYSKQLQQLQGLKASLLDAAFRGKL